MRGRYADRMATFAWSVLSVFRLPCNRPFGNRADAPPDAPCPPSELLRGLQRLLLGRFLLLLQPLRGHFPALREMFCGNCLDTARLLPG